MSEIKFHEEDVERVMIAANDILKNDIIPLLKNNKQSKAYFHLEKLVMNLVVCQTEMAYRARKSSIAMFFIKWKYQIKQLQQKMLGMKNEDIIFEIENIIATFQKQFETENLSVA